MDLVGTGLTGVPGGSDEWGVDDLVPGLVAEGARRVSREALSEALFETMLTPIWSLAGGAHLEGLLDELRVDRTGHLQPTLAEAATINQTSFFRDAKVFAMLRREILPRLIAARRRERRLRVWCAGCSTGQEAFSLGMLLDEFSELQGWEVSVLGTDVSQDAIAYAERGLYRGREVMDGLDASLLRRYFEETEGLWRVGGKLRGMCSFACWNLCHAFPAMPVFDLVLMRNVLFYMDSECRNEVFLHVRRQMALDGALVMGELERAEEAAGSFEEELGVECSWYRPAAGA